MKYNQLLASIFNTSITLNEENNVISGLTTYNNQQFAICGIVNNAALDNIRAQQLAKFILEQSELQKPTIFIILLDTSGQEATRHAELIGLNRYCAHLAKTIHFIRSQGARVFSLVYGSALGGAFIATGLNAEKIYALAEAKIAVMWLEAMSRVTKIPLEKLQQLSTTSAVFAPGADNFVKLGAVEAILTPEQIMPQILQDLKQPTDIHHWRENGKLNQGRILAAKIVTDILNA